jgi:hypothetical protein
MLQVCEPKLSFESLILANCNPFEEGTKVTLVGLLEIGSSDLVLSWTTPIVELIPYDSTMFTIRVN